MGIFSSDNQSEGVADRLAGLDADKLQRLLDLLDGQAEDEEYTSEAAERKRSTSHRRKPKTFDQWQELRKKDRSRYHSPESQRQILADREALGEDFYRKTVKSDWD